MKKKILIICVLTGLLTESFMQATGAAESNMDNTFKPKVNVSGSLTTHQGNAWKEANNITFERRYLQIQMYLKPIAGLPPASKNVQTGHEEIILKEDPATYAVVYIDLPEVEKIQSIAGLTYLFTAVRGTNTRELKYVELLVTLRDKKIAPYRCLVPESTRVMWDEMSIAGPINNTIKIGSLADLTIVSAKENKVEQPEKIAPKVASAT